MTPENADGLTLLVWQAGGGVNWRMDLASIRPFVKRVVLAEHGAGRHLTGPLGRCFPGVEIAHLRLSDASPEVQTEELGSALGAGWVLALEAGANVFADPRFKLPGKPVPQCAVHLLAGNGEACWAPVLAPDGGKYVRAGPQGEVFIDTSFDEAVCNSRLTVDARRAPGAARGTSARDLDRALEACRGSATPERMLEVAACHFELERFEEAAFWYRRCLAGLERPADQWTARYYLALCLKRAGEPWPAVESAMAGAFEHDPYRAEPLFYIASHYRDEGDYARAHDLARMGLECELPGTPGRFDYALYRHKLPLLYMACAAAIGRDRDCVRAANEVLRRQGLPDRAREEAAGYRSRCLARIQPCYPLNIRKKNRIVVVVPFRNAGSFLAGCVASLAAQRYEHCRFILIDDASTDGALDRLALADPRFVVERNAERQGVLRNQVDAVRRHGEPEDIVAYVDGDDRLVDESALGYVNDFFNSTRCWIMYGQYRRSDGRYGRCEPIISTSSDVLEAVGEMHFPMHIRAHRAGLMHHLLRADPGLDRLRDARGGFLDSISDMALMRALMQLAGLENIRYNDRVLYEYNVRNPESHYSAFEKKQLQDRQSRILASKPRLDAAASFMPQAPSRPGARAAGTALLFIALDGVNPGLVREWGAAGHLPCLHRLFREGATRQVEASPGLGNDAFWISLATGTLPGESGYYYRLHWDPEQYRAGSFEPAEKLPVRPFWTSLEDSDAEVAVIDFPETRSAGPVNGFEVGEWMTHAALSAPRFFPDSLEQDWIGRFGSDPLQGCTETMGPRTGEQFAAVRDQLLDAVDRKTRAAAHYLDRGGWDLFAVAFSQGHDMGHQFWHVHDPEHPAHRRVWLERYGDPLLQVYQRIDRAVATLVERAGEGAAWLLLSGLAMDAKISCNVVFDAVLRAIETSGWGREVGGAAPGDRSGRRFFAIPNNSVSGAVRVNLKGRERAGVVEPGADYELTLDRIEAGIGRVVNAATGAPVAARCIRLQEYYPGPRAAGLPDMLVLWNRESPITAIRSPWFDRMALRPRDVVDTRTGDHLCSAEMTTCLDPPFPSGRPVPVQDIAPWLAERVRQSGGSSAA